MKETEEGRRAKVQQMRVKAKKGEETLEKPYPRERLRRGGTKK